MERIENIDSLSYAPAWPAILGKTASEFAPVAEYRSPGIAAARQPGLAFLVELALKRQSGVDQPDPFMAG
jgi:hypothetical protein